MRSRLHSSERWRRRRPITSLTLCGIASGAVAGSSRRLSAASSRTISPTKRGLPSVSACTAALMSAAGAPGAASLDEAGDVGLVEADERKRPRDGLASQLGERRRERIREGRIDVAVRADDQQAAVAELASDEPQKQKRGLVGRVQVVEHQHQRPRGRHALQEGGHGIEQSKARTVGLERRRRRQIGEDGRGAREAAAPRRPLPREVGLEDSPRRSRARYGRSDCTQGQYAGAPPASQQRPTSTRAPRAARLRDQLLGEAALADAGLADEQEQTPAAGEGVVEPADQLGQLALAAHERAARASRAGSRTLGRCRPPGGAPGPARGSPARARADARPARCPARRPASGARPGRPAARPPGGPSGRARASAAPAGALGTDARRSAPPAGRPARHGRRAPSFASISCSSAATRRSSSRAISRCANGSYIKSALFDTCNIIFFSQSSVNAIAPLIWVYR